MPTPTKPADQRVGARTPLKVIDSQSVAAVAEDAAPLPPKGLSAEREAEWYAYWASEFAPTVNRVFHLDPLRRLFALRERIEQFDEEGMEQPMVQGSKEQQQLNPLLKESRAMRAELLQLEDRFGLNPLAWMKLGLATGEAHKSLDEVNQRLRDRAGGAAVEHSDPRRATAIDTRTA
jgi:hypothetical protein